MWILLRGGCPRAASAPSFGATSRGWSCGKHEQLLERGVRSPFKPAFGSSIPAVVGSSHDDMSIMSTSIANLRSRSSEKQHRAGDVEKLQKVPRVSVDSQRESGQSEVSGRSGQQKYKEEEVDKAEVKEA